MRLQAENFMKEENMKKYELTAESKEYGGRKLFRIKALVSFGNVKKGELGGWIEKEQNLSHSGNAWVYDKAKVYGKAQIYGKAKICGYKDYIVIGPIGSRNAYTTFYRREDDVIMVVCGCFHDTLAAFEKRVAEVHGNNQYGKDYMVTIDYVRKVINTNGGQKSKAIGG